MSTKLCVPRSTPNLLSRARLNDALATQDTGSLTLISAPAGYGKTTLVCDFLRQQPGPIAWYTVDSHDNDPVLFWRYLIAALQTVEPRLGLQAQAMLGVISRLSSETIATLVMNDVASLIPANASLTLVLDDFHWIQSATIFQGLNFLLQHQPSQLRLILLARSDPPLSLARLRVAGRLLELRAADLRLIPDEIKALLNDVMALDVPGNTIQFLAGQTEGWAAGLQLVALSLRRSGAGGASQLMTTIGSANQHIFAYLVEEVLSHQSEDVRRFLRQTALLRQFSAPLCSAVTGQDNSGALLRHLVAENLFITPLDDGQEWYRYHPLFAETLLANLPPAERQACHRRAARWYAGQELWQHALRNAFAAKDYDFVASLLTRSYKTFLGHGLMVTLQQWLAALPEEFKTPRLRLASGWTRVYESSEQELQQIVDAITPSLAADDQPFRGEMLAVQAVYASLYGDLHQSRHWATEALTLIAPDDALSRAAAYQALGNSYRYQGELDAALAAYRQAQHEFEVMGSAFMGQLPLYRSAHILILQGRLHQALHTYESVRDRARAAGQEPAIMVGEIFGYLSEIFCEWNDLEQAETFARREIELAQSGNTMLALVDGYLKLATVTTARGDLAAARHALILAAEAAAQFHSAPVTAQIALYQARFELDQGNLPAAAAWAADYARRRHTPECALTPLQAQSADLLLARIWLAEGRAAAAIALLQETLQEVEACGRIRLVVEANVLLSLAWAAQKQAGAASKALTRALAIAKAEDYVRVFVENGPALLPLLRQVRHLFPTYVATLLAAMHAGSATAASEAELPLAEPLTPRELEIVGLIAQGCSNNEIASRLVLSVGTVKGHISHIFDKLGVSSRTQALLRARELNLVD